MCALSWRRGVPLLRDRRGQATVELALVLPVLVLVVVGIFEFALAWRTHQVLTHAAREGARAAAVDDPLVGRDSVEALVRNAFVQASLDPAQARIQLTGVNGASGTTARVEVRYPVPFAFLKSFMKVANEGRGMSLSTAAVMRNE